MNSSLCIAAIALLCVSVHAGGRKSYDSDSDEEYGGHYGHRRHGHGDYGGHHGHGGYGGHHGHGGHGGYGGYGGYGGHGGHGGYGGHGGHGGHSGHGGHDSPHHPHHPHFPPHGPFPPGPPPTFPTGGTKFPTGTPPVTATAAPSTAATVPPTDPLSLCPATKDGAPFLATQRVRFEDVTGKPRSHISTKPCAECASGNIQYAAKQLALDSAPTFVLGKVKCSDLCVCDETNRCFVYNDKAKQPPAPAVFIPFCPPGPNVKCNIYMYYESTTGLDGGFGLVPEDGQPGKKYLVSGQTGSLKDFLVRNSPIIRTISCGVCAKIDATCAAKRTKRDVLNEDGDSSRLPSDKSARGSLASYFFGPK